MRFLYPTLGFVLCVVFFVGCFPSVKELTAEKKEEDVVNKVLTIGQVTKVGGAAPIIVSGIGLVTGLDGTGGGTPSGTMRKELEMELRRQKISGSHHLLDALENAMVLVVAKIPPGVQKGELLDAYVSLPPGSRATSLRGGYLHVCPLYDRQSTKQLNPQSRKPNEVLKGHMLAKARGQLLVGLDRAAGKAKLKQGLIWDGAVSLTDRSYFLTLNHDRQFATIANAVATKINSKFRETFRDRLAQERFKSIVLTGQIKKSINRSFRRSPMDEGKIAKATNPKLIQVQVPAEYRFNAKRYLRVVRLIPLREDSKLRAPYRNRLKEMLLDPAHTVTAALRLEALGKESMPTLLEGLKSTHSLVRFTSAESLAYLGNPTGVEELAILGDQHPEVRAYCLTAMASLDESITHTKLFQLLESPNTLTRYGAFRALQLLRNENPMIQGELLNGSFWVHRVAPKSRPVVHFTSNRRPEVVLFGEVAYLKPPYRIMAGDYTVVADAGDRFCTISWFHPTKVSPDNIPRQQCSHKIEAVIRTMAGMGADYTDVVEVLRQVGDRRAATCPVVTNAIPRPIPAKELAEGGLDPDFMKPVEPGLRMDELPTSYQDESSTPATLKQDFRPGEYLE
ncbi:MAG: flagellar basal body P-ring protein FlgI [Gemmataceae bacterium]